MTLTTHTTLRVAEHISSIEDTALNIWPDMNVEVHPESAALFLGRDEANMLLITVSKSRFAGGFNIFLSNPNENIAHDIYVEGTSQDIANEVCEVITTLS